jgi:hypothetical protein
VFVRRFGSKTIDPMWELGIERQGGSGDGFSDKLLGFIAK